MFKFIIFQLYVLKSIDKIWISFSIPILVIAGVFAYATLENIHVKEGEWSNNATLIAEVGVGIVVTLIVLMITKINEKKIDGKIEKIKNVVVFKRK